MSSPEEIPFSSFIKIDRDHHDAIYLQIVYQLINAIKRGQLSEGNKLPGSRLLAQELGVHRKTIIAALDELRDQDWIETIPNIGSFIKNPENKNIARANIQLFSERYGEIPISQNYILDIPTEDAICPLHFTDGQPDYRIIKSEELARFYSGVLRRKLLKQKSLYPSSIFYEQLCNYLNSTRNFHLERKYILSSGSREIILNILTQIIVKRGDLVLVSELNYFFANMTFRQSGAHVQTIPTIDGEINLQYIREHFRKGEIRLLYLQPKFQYPNTQSLSSQQRKELLSLAQEDEFIIIEDDTDHEFSFERNQNFSLFKENKNSWVIYLGSFGRFLIPGFQSYFMIGAENLITEAKKYLNLLGNIDLYKEQALAEIISEGDIHRYRRKVQKIYKERRNLFALLLQEAFQKEIHFHIPKGGLAFWLEFNSDISLVQWAENCQKRGLYIPKFCMYQDKKRCAMRLGFAHLNEEEMRQAISIFSESYFEIKGR